MYGENALAIFIRPPSFEILELRLRARATDKEESLQKRLSKVKWELGFEKDFDQVIVNDNLDEALLKAEKLVSRFLKIS
jgi:guanylate kinase